MLPVPEYLIQVQCSTRVLDRCVKLKKPPTHVIWRLIARWHPGCGLRLRHFSTHCQTYNTALAFNANWWQSAHSKVSIFSHFVLIFLTPLPQKIAVLNATLIYCVYTAVRQPYCSPLLSTLRIAPYHNITMANPRFMHLSTYGVGYTWSSVGGTEAIRGFCGKIEGRWRSRTEKKKCSGRGSHTSSAVEHR